MKINATAVFITAACFGALTIAGVAVLDIMHIQNVDGFVTEAGVIMTILIGFAAQLSSNQNQNQKLDQVEMKVNGNLSRALELAAQNGADPTHIAAVAASTGVAPPLTSPIPVTPVTPGEDVPHV